jgi:tRNA wybutosine-synthesizing protein 3
MKKTIGSATARNARFIKSSLLSILIMKFDELKSYALRKLDEALSRNEVDEPIIPLLNTINSLEDYFTTSSCAGRIVLMKIPKSGRKNEAEFLFKTHFPTEPRVVLKALESLPEESVWFKQEPFIIHVSARDLDKALKLLELAQRSGLKHSGIISIKPERVVLEIQSTERIETIVAKGGKLLVNNDYIEVLVHEANQKLIKTRERMNKFRKLVLEASERL